MKTTILIIRIAGNKEFVCALRSIFISKLFAEELDLIDYPQQGIEQGYFDRSNPPGLVVVLHASDYATWRVYKKIKHAWGDKPFILSMTEEAYDILQGVADFALSYKQDSASNIYLIASWLLNNLNLEAHTSLIHWDNERHKTSNKFVSIYGDAKGPDDIRELIYAGHHTPKDRFCNFIYSRRNLRYPGVRQRNKLCRTLNKYNQVDCAGRVMRNTDELKELEANNPPSTAKLKFISRYKFTIAAENRSSPFYITEKVLYPLLVGSIPIYCGTKEISKLINPKAFINCNDYNSFKQVVARVKEIDNDSELYAEYTKAPLFLDDSLVYNMSADRLKNKLHPVLIALNRRNELLANEGHPSFKSGQENLMKWKPNLWNQLSNYLEYAIKKKIARISSNEA